MSNGCESDEFDEFSFGEVVGMELFVCLLTLLANGMENLKSDPFGNFRIIFPDVIKRPKPSWWAKAYPDLNDRLALLVDGVRKMSWLWRDLRVASLCFSLTRSDRVGLTSIKKNLHDSTGITNIMHDITVVNQNVGSIIAWVWQKSILLFRYNVSKEISK